MKLVYICSPYRAADKETLKRNIEYAEELTREVLLQGDCPVTPHLYMTRCLNEDIGQERDIGLQAGMEILKRCDAIIVGTKYGISEGMAAEVECAKDREMLLLIEYGRKNDNRVIGQNGKENEK